MDPNTRSPGASERDQEARGAWLERLSGVDPTRLVIVDEFSTKVAFVPRYARAPKGEIAYGKALRNRRRNVTLISSRALSGMGPSLSIEGLADGEPFGLYLREFLCPASKPGQIMVINNLSVHKSAWVGEAIEARGASVLLLPPYSPDHDPVEEVFFKSSNS